MTNRRSFFGALAGLFAGFTGKGALGKPEKVLAIVAWSDRKQRYEGFLRPKRAKVGRVVRRKYENEFRHDDGSISCRWLPVIIEGGGDD